MFFYIISPFRFFKMLKSDYDLIMSKEFHPELITLEDLNCLRREGLDYEYRLLKSAYNSFRDEARAKDRRSWRNEANRFYNRIKRMFKNKS